MDVLRTALTRGAFEFQGQKCSAASRAYIPRSVWSRLRDGFVDEVNGLSMGDVTDFSNFMGAVIDQRSFDRLTGVLERVRGEAGVDVLAGGTADDTEGYFVRPTVVQADNPAHEIFTTEYFGPFLGVFVYDDADYDQVIREAADIAPYGLTGAVIAQDRAAISRGDGGAAVLGGQLLHQRQAHRCGRRAAALRRRAGQRHQRQGRVGAEPAALGVAAVGQGDIRTGHRLPLPAHGLTRSSTAAAERPERQDHG